MDTSQTMRRMRNLTQSEYAWKVTCVACSHLHASAWTRSCSLLPGEIPPIFPGVIGIPAFEGPSLPNTSKIPGNPLLSPVGMLVAVQHTLTVGSNWVSPEQFSCPGVSHICHLANASLGFEVELPLWQDEENKSSAQRQSSSCIRPSWLGFWALQIDCLLHLSALRAEQVLGE